MTALVTITLAAICAFYGYCLVRFGREIKLLRSQRATSVIPFRVLEERGGLDPSTKVTVMPVSRAAKRDVA